MEEKRHILASPTGYRLWMAPFHESKFAPIRRHNELAAVRRVLDVGCGPGTNAHHFAGMDYTGIDINERYIRYASDHHPGKFVAADATKFEVPPKERFDFVIINSFLHHLPDEDVTRILDHLRGVLTDDGHIHILELESEPDNHLLARLLVRFDRGDHARTRAHWMDLLSASFEPVAVEPFPLGRVKLEVTTLWNMLYFKGRKRSSARPDRPASR